MPFLTFFAAFAAALIIASLISEIADIFWPMWFTFLLGVGASQIWYDSDVNVVLSNLDLLVLVLKYLGYGLVFTGIKLFVRTLFIKMKLKRKWNEALLRSHKDTVENKAQFVEEFAKLEGLKYGDPLFTLSPEIVENDEGTEKYLQIKTHVNPTSLANRVFHWSVFWPMFLITFLFKDALVYVFTEISNVIIKAYRALLNSLFNGTL